MTRDGQVYPEVIRCHVMARFNRRFIRCHVMVRFNRRFIRCHVMARFTRRFIRCHVTAVVLYSTLSAPDSTPLFLRQL